MIADRTLLGGLDVDDAVRQASYWWDTKGRYLIRDTMTQMIDVKARYSPAAPGYIRREKSTDHEAGGILMCVPWPELTRAEQLEIVRKWHFFVWLPMWRPDLVPTAKPTWDQLPTPPKAATKVQ